MHEDGGGAVYVDCGSLLSVTSSIFISCSTKSYGAAIYAQHNLKTSVISYCSFIRCTGNHGGGMMTFYGPTSSIFSSRFISCTAERYGGGMYHNCNTAKGTLNFRDSLFTANKAKSESNHSRGGGAIEDYRYEKYSSTYLFLFFTGNTAPNGVGYDISTQDNALAQSCIIHCFTTTSSAQSFFNAGSHALTWLPQGIVRHAT